MPTDRREQIGEQIDDLTHELAAIRERAGVRRRELQQHMAALAPQLLEYTAQLDRIERLMRYLEPGARRYWEIEHGRVNRQLRELTRIELNARRETNGYETRIRQIVKRLAALHVEQRNYEGLQALERAALRDRAARPPGRRQWITGSSLPDYVPPPLAPCEPPPFRAPVIEDEIRRRGDFLITRAYYTLGAGRARWRRYEGFSPYESRRRIWGR